MLFSVSQLFWEKRLQGLSASDVSEQIIKSMELPKGLQGSAVPSHPSLCFERTQFDALTFPVYNQIK